MIKPTTSQNRKPGGAHSIEFDPLDAAALVETVRKLEAKLEAVSRSEQAFRESMTRLEDEVRAAGALQRSLMPGDLPAIEGARVQLLFRPCSSVSGDAYDVFRIDDSHIGFAVTDATGHGTPAALLTTLIRRTLRDVRQTETSVSLPCPSRVLDRANDELLGLGLEDCQFVAIVYALFNEHTGVVRLARGGAPYPVILSAGAGTRVVESAGPIVGAVPEVAFEVAEFVLNPGERLLLYTDGIEPLIGAGSSADSVHRAWDNFVRTIQYSDASVCESQRRASIGASSIPTERQASACAIPKKQSRFALSNDVNDVARATGVLFDHLEQRLEANHADVDDVTVLVIEREQSV